MTYFRVCDDFSDHPKVEGLSLAAVGLWTLVGSWCGKFSNSGSFSRERVKKLGGSKRLIDELIAHNLWETDGENLKFHDFNGNGNPTKKQVDDFHEKRSNAGRKGGSRPSKPQANTQANAKQTGKQTPSTVLADDTKQNGTLNLNPKPNILSTNNVERVAPAPPSPDIESWKPKPSHYQSAMGLCDRGYQLVDVNDLAEEFRLAIQAKGIGHYGYRDLDAAFESWVRKRAKSLRDQRQASMPSYPPAPAAPGEHPKTPHRHTWKCEHTLALLHRDEATAEPDDTAMHAAQLLNDGKGASEALEALGLESDELEAIA
ncbi:MAG: hypothetical protein LKF93_09555 [Bifidobacterium tibiigranuli]|jgi:hypothetical protein|nr:hypothetical protein [Bifidobacterium tibiigranuli]